MRNKEEITTSEETEVSVLDATPIEETPMTTSAEVTKPASADSKFQELLNKKIVTCDWLGIVVKYTI